MFDRYYYTKSFCRLKIWVNGSKSSFLDCYYDAQEHEGFVGFKNACSRAKSYVILTSLNYVYFYARYCLWRQFFVTA